MKIYDVYDARSALRLVNLASMSGALYADYASRFAEKLRTARYIAVSDEGIMAGKEPAPYFYVYSVSRIDPIQWALDKNPAMGVDFITMEKQWWVEECRVKAVSVFEDGRWIFAPPRYCYKVYAERPELVIHLREPFLTDEAFARGIYASGFNIKYAVRVTWDEFKSIMGYRPLWETGEALNEVPRPDAPIYVFDIEVVKNELYIVSVLRHRLLEEPRRDDVEVVVCKAGGPCDDLMSAFKKARILYGHNILGFDIPHLIRKWFVPELALASKLDGVKILSSHGNSFQIGASKSLYAVARRLKAQAGITDEELRVKEESGRILASGDLNEIIRYNVNDVILAAKLANVLLPFVYSIAALVAVPPSVVQELQAGVIAEYLVFRFLEYRGFLPGYKKSNANMSGSKVLLPCAYTHVEKTILELIEEFAGRR